MRPLLIAAMAAVLLAGCASPDDAASDSLDETEQVGLGPEPSGQPTRLPIILAHGFDASPTNRWGFNGVAEALRADGHTVYVATVPPYDSPEVRAAYLAKYVDQAIADGAEGVNIIAHSMGGLDSRYLISSMGYGKYVWSLTTISTPHQGSGVADAVLSVLDGLHADDDLIDALASLWGRTYSDVADDSHVRAALEGISEKQAAAFNETNPDDPQVFYQSWAGVSSVAGIKNPQDRSACENLILGDYQHADAMNASLVPMAGFVAHGWHLYPNDGMVRVESAKWGTFRGCIPTDHLDEVGYQHDGPDERTRFDHLRFYRNLAYELAAFGY
jgi:triacylglycerol lipase